MIIYLALTREFNASRLRAVLCGGQAAVLHRLAIASKDGAWILREEPEVLEHVLDVLASRGARYRFGAPLDPLWLSGGWSAHLEFLEDGKRVRTDFFTRPPRVGAEELARLWIDEEGSDPPFTKSRILAEMKKTDRLKDYAVIGELARRMPEPRDQLLYSRSAEDLLELAGSHPDLVRALQAERAVLAKLGNGRRAVAEALQLEMLDMMEVNERRLAAYRTASAAWGSVWLDLSRDIDRLPLREAHALMVERARGVLPERIAP